MSNQPIVPVIVASENGRRGALAAMDLLMSGGAALDAAELACRIVEDDPTDQSVGYGGLPNLLGEVELDASIMDGRTLRAGAVAALKGYGNPIALARRVMEETPHVLLTGAGAARFAAEVGQSRAEQRTQGALQRWRARFAERNVPMQDHENLRHVAMQMTAPLNLQDQAAQGERIDTLGTVNFLVLDSHGSLASGVSTSGLGWKYPGRVGDSPLIGAGNYCDNRYGAVACTGMGELAVRAGTARSLTLYLKAGMTLAEAGAEALRDLLPLNAGPGQYMNIIALTPSGEHAGFTTVPGKQYLYMTGTMAEPALVERYALAHPTG